MELVISFGRGMGLDTIGVNHLLRAVDYPQIVDESQEIVGVIEPEEIYVAARDNDFSEEDARKLMKLVEELRKEKARRRGAE